MSRVRAAELNGSGALISRFVYAGRPNVPDYVVQSGVTYRLIHDQVGSVRLVVNASTGAIAQRLDYDAYGRVLSNTAPDVQPFGFAGGLYDSQTGLVRFTERDYVASAARWSVADPLMYEGSTRNLYQYAKADPINRADPSGRFATAIDVSFASVLRGSLTLQSPLTVRAALGILIYTDCGLVAWETYVQFAKGGKQGGGNWVLDDAKNEAQRTGRAICEILLEWLAEGKAGDETPEYIKAVEAALKFAGCKGSSYKDRRKAGS